MSRNKKIDIHTLAREKKKCKRMASYFSRSHICEKCSLYTPRLLSPYNSRYIVSIGVHPELPVYSNLYAEY